MKFENVLKIKERTSRNETIIIDTIISITLFFAKKKKMK